MSNIAAGVNCRRGLGVDCVMELLKRHRRSVLFVFDAFVIFFSYVATVFVVSELIIPSVEIRFSWAMLGLVEAVYMLSFLVFRVYSIIWRYARARQLVKFIFADALAETVILVMIYISDKVGIYYAFLSIIQAAFITILILASRIVYIYLFGMYKSNLKEDKDCRKERVMVIGAGDMAALFFDDSANRAKYDAVCIVDDDPAKLGRRFKGVKVVGGTADIVSIAVGEDIETIIFCIKDIADRERRRILAICSETDCNILKMSIGLKNDNSYTIQKISIDDLLGRKAVTIENDGLREFIGGKCVMVTGGGGSIGSELCRNIARLAPSRLVIVDNYENNAYDIQQELIRTYKGKLNMETEIASVCDREKMRKLFTLYKPDIIYHAAAHKHVPFMEHDPEEAVKNNIFGTLTTARLADEFGVKRFVLVSTDKAVNPTNVMGATKRCCEMIVQGMDRISKTEFVAVRFGNVLGSHGSVIPLFERQIMEGGPVTVTDPEIIRYFMTIPEAVQLLLAAGSMAKGGEIFILDMGEPVKIADLAKQMIRLSGHIPNGDIKIEYTGLRPGEKLYEELLMAEEGLTNTEYEKIFIGAPSFVDINELTKQLDALKEVANRNDSDGVKKMMAEIVPTYHMAKR